jgi:hypothetical protein
MFSLLTVQIHFLHFRLQNLSLIMYVSPSEQTLMRFASHDRKGPGGSMSYVIGLPNNSYKPITNTAWVRARLCKLQERVHSTRSRK